MVLRNYRANGLSDSEETIYEGIELYKHRIIWTAVTSTIPFYLVFSF
jgi:hypothetical protein